MSETKRGLNDVANQDIGKRGVSNRTITTSCNSVLSSNSLPCSRCFSSSSSNCPLCPTPSSDLVSSSVSPTPSPPENMSRSCSSPPSLTSHSSTSPGSSPLFPANFCGSSLPRSTETKENSSSPLDLHFRSLEPQASGSNSSAVSLTSSRGSSSSHFVKQASSPNKVFSLYLTSGSQNSKEFSHSSTISSSSNCQTDAELLLLQPSTSSQKESYIFEGSYVPHGHVNSILLNTKRSRTSITNQCKTAQSCQTLLTTSSPKEPQSIEYCNLNPNANWSDLDPLQEARWTLEILIEMFSESKICSSCSIRESNYPEREPTSDDNPVKEPTLKAARLDPDATSESHFRINKLLQSLPSSSSQPGSSTNVGVTKSSRSVCESTSQTTAGARWADTEILHYQTDHSYATQQNESNYAEFRKLHKSLKQARSDILTFARYILNECGKHPDMDLERLYDFKYCYTTFAAEEYKLLEEKLSAYKEADEHEMLVQRIAYLTYLEEENHRFLARLQYAIFMLKLHLKFNEEVKDIVMNIREMEKHIYTIKGWQASSETENND